MNQGRWSYAQAGGCDIYERTSQGLARRLAFFLDLEDAAEELRKLFGDGG